MTTARPLDKIFAGLAFILGLATILGALGSQYFGGLQPCALCLEQRLPYYWGLPLLALIIVFWNRLPLPAWYMGMGLVTALFAWGTYMGLYHAGVEWGFWPGPTSCTGTGIGGSISLESLSNLQPIIGCDVVQFRFLGISLAGYNALISAGITGLLIASMVIQYRRAR